MTSLTGKLWLLPERPLWRAKHSEAEILGALRRVREITNDPETGRPFFSLDGIPDLPIAIDRIRLAVKQQERVGLFGDYDCDGVTGTLILLNLLRRAGFDPLVRLPHRSLDGYGLKEHIVEEFARAGISLLLTIDTGITANDAIATARARGIDVIILDHHHPPEILPPATAIIHPARSPLFPEPWPCAAGLACAFVENVEGVEWEGQDEDEALAAIGTVADCVMLRGGNRSLVRRGLEMLSGMTDGPLAALCEIAGCRSPITSADIGFRLAPRINAAGRMEHPEIALKALLGDDDALIRLGTLNALRQDKVAWILEDTLEHVSTMRDDPLIAMQDDAIHPGIAGILAGKLTESTGKPSFIAVNSGDFSVASLRSTPAYDIVEGLRRVAGQMTDSGGATTILNFGGHALAAGCTFPSGAFERIAGALARDIAKHVSAEDLVPQIRLDGTLTPSHISMELAEGLQSLEPFGQGNLEPRFLLERVRLANMRMVGRERSHLQATVGAFKCIGWRLAPLAPQCAQDVDVICRLSIDRWNGARRVQLEIDDIRVAIPTPIATV